MTDAVSLYVSFDDVPIKVIACLLNKGGLPGKFQKAVRHGDHVVFYGLRRRDNACG